MEKINKALYPRYFFGGINNSLLNKIKHALFLDYDGTLVPIQKDPSLCILSSKIKSQLKLLAGSDRCYLTILSGRSLPDIRKMAGIRNICYGGNHGLDLSGPGIRYTHPKALLAKPLMKDVKYLLKKEIAGIKGAWVEDKRFTVSLHYRSVKTTDIPLVKKAFYNAAEGFLSKKLMAVVKGKKVFELVPDVSWDKGKAIFYILEHLKNKWFPIYIGDDKTDENAFRALNKMGITIRVGKSAKTAANYYLKNQWEISKFLNQLIMITSDNSGGIAKGLKKFKKK